MDTITDASKLVVISSCLTTGLLHYSYFQDCSNKSHISPALLLG